MILLRGWECRTQTHTHPAWFATFKKNRTFKIKTGTIDKFARNSAVPRVSRLSQKTGRPFFWNEPAFLEVPLLPHPLHRIPLGHFAFFSYDREVYLEKCLCVVNIFWPLPVRCRPLQRFSTRFHKKTKMVLLRGSEFREKNKNLICVATSKKTGMPFFWREPVYLGSTIGFRLFLSNPIGPFRPFLRKKVNLIPIVGDTPRGCLNVVNDFRCLPGGVSHYGD